MPTRTGAEHCCCRVSYLGFPTRTPDTTAGGAPMMRYISLCLMLAAAGCARVAPVPSFVPDLPDLQGSQEAPAAFDSKSNGMVDDATHEADRTKFDEVEEISDG